MIIPDKNHMLKLGTGMNAVDVAYMMAEMCRMLQSDPYTLRIAQIFKDTNVSLYELCNAVYRMAYFEPDPPTTQVIRTPHATLRDESANCVDYTVMLATMALVLGWGPIIIRIVSFNRTSKKYTHVYPIINGRVCDLVIGQDQKGNERNVRQNINFVHFGKEVPYTFKFDTII